MEIIKQVLLSLFPILSIVGFVGAVTGIIQVALSIYADYSAQRHLKTLISKDRQKFEELYHLANKIDVNEVKKEENLIVLNKSLEVYIEKIKNKEEKKELVKGIFQRSPEASLDYIRGILY